MMDAVKETLRTEMPENTVITDENSSTAKPDGVDAVAQKKTGKS
jgi:hypothetical protein